MHSLQPHRDYLDPFNFAQNNAIYYAQQRYALAAPAGAPPPPPPGGDCCDCWNTFARCMVSVAQAIGRAVRDLFREICLYFAGDRAFNDHLDAGDEIARPIGGVGNAGLQGEIDDYCARWTRESHGEKLVQQYLEANDPRGILKYIAFVTLRRFEYADYPANYREHYFDDITRRAKLLTMELLKLESDRAGTQDRGEREAIARRVSECLREVAKAAATGCDPRKASVTMQQWKAVSGRVEIYEILLQHIQDAKLAVFKSHVSNGNMDTSVWAVHAYNWIYTHFGVQYGLCSKARAEAASRDGYSRSASVANMVAPLQDLLSSGQIEHTFRQQFSQKYLEDALLDAINRDEYQRPYIECLQNFNPEVQEDPKKFDEYVTTNLGRYGMVSYVFKPAAVQFFLNLRDGQRDLAIDWGNDILFWSFIQDRMPISLEDTISEQDINKVSLVNLLRLYRAFVS